MNHCAPDGAADHRAFGSETTVQPPKDLIDDQTAGIYFLDRSRRIIYWSPGAERLTGYLSSDVLGRCCADRLLQHMDASGQVLCNAGCPLEATMRDGKGRAIELFLHHKKGHRVPVTVRAIPIRGLSGEILGAVEVFNDVSGHDFAAERIRELGTPTLIDPLTGAGNQRFAEVQIASRLAEKKRTGLTVGLLLVEIDSLGSINERYGHSAGADTLAAVGRTLAHALRAGDFLARWDGGRFVILAVGLEGRSLADAGQRVRAVVKRSGVPARPGLKLSLSIGVTQARIGDTVASLVARADALRREAKSRGPDRVANDLDDYQA